MSDARERGLTSPKNTELSFQSKRLSFLLWLLMVDLKITADATAQSELNDYTAQNPEQALLYSVAPHTGHPDSLYVYKAVEQLTPHLISNLQFVSAKDTWSSRRSKMIARNIINEPYLFDRENQTIGSMKTQVHEMAQLLQPEDDTAARSLAIYPQGTRTIGAPIENMPVMLAHEANVAMAVLNIYGGEPVMPKVEKGQQTSQVIQILLERLRTRRAKHHVTVKLMDFIPPGESRKAIKERFLGAHHQPLSQG